MRRLRLRVTLPFIEATGRNQATPRFVSRTKRGFCGNRLSARVDGLVTDLLVLGPERYQTPVHIRHDSLAVDQADYGHTLRGRNIKAIRQRVADFDEIEIPLDGGFISRDVA